MDLDAPAFDEIEVSVFGPGYGECVLIHAGDGHWAIVDSCINPFSKLPASLEYLKAIGADPAHCVKSVIVTHWHDDHIRGMAEILRHCEQAEFCCSIALRNPEFLTLVQSFGERSLMVSSGVQEFYEILKAMSIRAKASKDKCPPPKWAIADRLLWEKRSGVHGEIKALSPSDTSVVFAQQDIARLIPNDGTCKRRVMSISPNYVAVVLWVKIGDSSLLLGSDLEETGDPRTGWTVIVDSKTRPVGEASIYKVPHHGSQNADLPIVWSEMLEKNPIAILTPFSKGRKRLPTEDDVRRICALAGTAYQTAILKEKTLKRPKLVEQMLQGAVRSIRQVNSSFGHVRLRLTVGAPHWTVSLFGSAVALKTRAAG